MTGKGLRVLLVVTRGDTIGGSHTHLISLARGLLDRGHDVLVAFGPPSDGPFADQLDRHGIAHTTVGSLVRPIRPWSDRRARAELIALIESFAPDVVHCHSSKAGVIGRLAARTASVPAVFTAHGWAFTDGVPAAAAAVWSRVERWVARRCPGPVIVVSEEDRRLAVERRVVPEDRVVVVHNGVPDVAPDLLADPSARPASVVMVARLDAQKDHDTLLAALTLLGRDLRVVCVGDGPRASEVRAAADAAGLTGVELVGLRHDVDALLAAAQVFVLTTHWEGLPISIVEAMRAGLPTIASDVGGVDELVVDGATGFLVPRGDAPAVAARLGELLDDPAKAAEQGQRARERYLAELTVGRMVEATVAVYRGLS